MRVRFITSTPLDIQRGSGTFVGIRLLARALEALGHEVEFETPRLHLPVYTLERLAFNLSLRRRPEFDLTVGFDLDGYRIARGNPSHVAALKGVIADEARFERGATRLTMEMQARCERRHARRAARVLATSRYSAERAQEFYGLKALPAIVPEAIDLAEWRRLLEANPSGQTPWSAAEGRPQTRGSAPHIRRASRSCSWEGCTGASAWRRCSARRRRCVGRFPSLRFGLSGTDRARRPCAG